jgi:hypothetical protein
MMATQQKPKYTISIDAPANGRLRQSTVMILEGENVVANDKGDLSSNSERRKVAKNLAEQTGRDEKKILKALEKKWYEMLSEHQRFRKQAEAGSAEAAPEGTIQLLDAAPLTIRRPLCLLDGKSYAASWVPIERTTTQGFDPNGGIVKYDPPLVTVAEVLVIVASDGTLYTDADLPSARPLGELKLQIQLPTKLHPDCGWSGAGLKRYLSGDRPDPADLFGRVKSVADRFIDFARSFGSQGEMCELTACYVLATWLLDAFNVVGYLWPNGEPGSGKTTYLHVVGRTAYLGQVILNGSTYSCLRDMANYGATLCFDDAENVMDVRRTDPDKRALLLAGNHRGAYIAVKVPAGDRGWEIQYVDTFCPRLFSAIRLPDPVLGSRSVTVPLVRSGDDRRAKADPQKPEDWPCDRRRLIDDLWAMGLANLPKLPRFDQLAAELSSLSGRNLDPWRPVLAVAGWLEQCHGVKDLYTRMEKMSQNYQGERADIEENDKNRVLFRALLQLSSDWKPGQDQTLEPKKIADTMNALAQAEELGEPDKPFTSSRKVGHQLKRQRFRRPDTKDEKARLWLFTREEIVMAATTYGLTAEKEKVA